MAMVPSAIVITANWLGRAHQASEFLLNEYGGLSLQGPPYLRLAPNHTCRAVIDYPSITLMQTA